MSGAKNKKNYNQVFLDLYNKTYDFIHRSRKGETFAFCSVCITDINIAHGGLHDIKVHTKSKKHSDMLKCNQKCANIGAYFRKDDDSSVINAECLFTEFLVEHNLPIAAADHAGPLFRKMFPDSNIAKQYGAARTKTTAIIEKMANKNERELSILLSNVPFAVSTDGSNDSDTKLFPVVVTFFNPGSNEITNCLLSLSVLKSPATGANIGNLILDAITCKGLSIKNCLAFSTDNAPVMIGVKNGVSSILLKEQEELIVVGCPCHLIHLAAEKGAKQLPVCVDEYLIDIFFYLEKSSKRKEKLKELQIAFDVETHKILKHVCTRWLSLGRSLKRLIEQWNPVLSFFKDQIKGNEGKICSSLVDFKIPFLKDSLKRKDQCSEAPQKCEKRMKSNESSVKKKMHIKESLNKTASKSLNSVITREERIFMFLSSDLNKAYCNFLDFIIPVFEKRNIILQSQDPKVHILKSVLEDLFKDLLIKFVKPCIMKDCSPLSVKYGCRENQREDSDIAIGNATLKVVNNLNNSEKMSFYCSIRKYFVGCCDYITHKFPLKSEYLKHAEVANLANIETKHFSDIQYFLNKFPFIVSNGNDTDEEIDMLQSEFNNIQIDKIPEHIIDEQRIDRQWGLVGDIKGPDGSYRYKRLSKIMLCILTIPHSNAECERIFSQVKKARTQFRSSLSDSALEKLLIIKLNQKGRCYEQEYDKLFLKEAKSAVYDSLKKK